MDKKWMIYGANGYTGTLITREAVKRGLAPILAGRSQSAITTLAQELNLEARVFTVDEKPQLLQQLSDVDLVLNCAGPFSKTVQPLLQACLATQCHYLDISGELRVFDYCFEQDDKAKQAHCIVCPGVAFDIVPTEIAAAKLKQLLPTTTAIKLGFDGAMALSKGSSITLLEGIGNPDLTVYMVRDAGTLLHLHHPRIESLGFANGQTPKKAMAITWADLNGAFYSTGIPNIAVYVPATLINRISFAYMNWLKPLFALRGVQSFLTRIINLIVKGPTAHEIESSRMTVFGEAHDGSGKVVRLHFTVPHGYKFTYLASVSIVQHFLFQANTGGYFTPSMLMGTDFIQTLEGCSEFQIEH